MPYGRLSQGYQISCLHRRIYELSIMWYDAHDILHKLALGGCLDNGLIICSEAHNLHLLIGLLQLRSQAASPWLCLSVA